MRADVVVTGKRSPWIRCSVTLAVVWACVAAITATSADAAITFSKQAVPVGTNPQAVAIGDFNGDGKPDLAVANGGSNTFTVLLNNGGGTYTQASYGPVATQTNPTAITVGDFGNGRPDIAVANDGSSTVSIYMNTGTGWSNTANYPVGADPIALVASDFNGDGAPDLATANAGSNSVSVLLATGSGTFGNASGSPVALSSGGSPVQPASIAAGDFNGDGVPDLALPGTGVSCFICLTVLTGAGDGTFIQATTSDIGGVTPQSSIVVGDLNRDGAPDLAVSNDSCYVPDTFLGYGGGQFLEPATPLSCSFSGPTSLAMADFDGSGAPELAAANNGAGAVQLLSVQYQGVIFPSSSSGAANGTASWTPLGSPIPAGAGPSAIATGDLNGDGKPDLVVANSRSDSVTVLLNTSQPAVGLSPSSLLFRPASVGSVSTSAPLTVSNTGSAPLSISGVSVVGQDADEFKVSGDSCSGTTIAAGASCAVGLRFTPSASGPAQAQLRISSNAPAAVTLVALSGAGLPSPVGGLAFSTVPDPAFAAGANGNGQLGTGGPVILSSPTPLVAGAGPFVALSAGGSHSLGLRADGTVWAWGANGFGQLGNGSTVDSHSPVPVPAPSGMVQVAAGFADSLALRSDGTVWAWGQNTYGQLGNGTTTGSSIPVQVSGLADVVAVAAGQYHSLALRSDGTVWAWGFKFADGASGQSSVPVQVPGLSRIVAIAAGQYHSLALKSDGTVWAWGYDTKGQLGNGGTAAQINPVQVWGLSGAVAIAAGGSHSLALLNGGTVDAWGSNSNGQLGNGTADSSAHSTAAAVPGLVGVTQLAAGLNHSLAVRGDGTGAAWGAGFQGQLGAGSPPQDSHAPTFVVIGNGAQVVFSGSTANHSLWLGQPHVGLSPGKLTFDAEPVGTPSPSLAETVTNNGVVPLQVGQATIIANALGADGDEFTITGDGCSNSTIAPGASCEIGVRFDPKVTGTPEAALRIPSNSPTSPDEPRLDPPRQVSTANRSANTITCTPAGIRHHKLALRCRLRHGLGHGKHRLTARLGRHAAHATIRGNARTVTIALPVPRGHRSYRLTITISGAISRVIEKIRV